MARKSIRERADALHRRLLGGDRFVACKLTVVAHDGEELFTVGGCWDRILRRYVDRPCEGRVFWLRQSQTEMGRAIGRYIAQRLANDDERVALMMAIGNRGGGKTLLLGGVLMVAIGLAMAGSYQMGVSITSKQNRELREAMRIVAAPAWLTFDCDDPRDPHTELVTGARVLWHTARNPNAMRQALLPFEHVLINEAQDQPEKVLINAVPAVRSGGLVSIATNPPQVGAGDWVAILHQNIAAGTPDAEAFVLRREDNVGEGISHPTVQKGNRIIRLVNPDAADADAEGIIKLSGDVGFPGFTKLERVDENGKWVRGHLGLPDLINWVDVTRQITAEHSSSGAGTDYVGGADFQTDPGSCCAVGKIYRLPSGALVLFVRELVATRGTEEDLTHALNERGYFPGPVDYDGKPAASLLLVGDATGARQNAEHRKRDPYSFTRLRADGWTVLPPDYYGPKRTPWNPLVADSRKQMKALFLSGGVLLSPDCLQGCEGFPSLVDSFMRVKVNAAGKFDKRLHLTHGPDGVRYLAWRFLPRPEARVDTSPDMDSFNLLKGTRLGWGR